MGQLESKKYPHSDSRFRVTSGKDQTDVWNDIDDGAVAFLGGLIFMALTLSILFLLV